ERRAAVGFPLGRMHAGAPGRERPAPEAMSHSPSILLRALAAVSILALAPGAAAQKPADYELPLRDLIAPEKVGETTRWDYALARAFAPYAILEGPGEACVLGSHALEGYGGARALVEGGTLCVRAPGDKDVKGRLFVPKSDLSGMLEVPFTIGRDKAATG